MSWPELTESRLARWGLLESARRESVRDQLMLEVEEPPEAIRAVLLRQWLQGRGLGSDAALNRWISGMGITREDVEAMVVRPWRWTQWCERRFAPTLMSRFLARKAGLDRVQFWTLQLDDEELVMELYLRLRAGEASFEQLQSEARDGAPWQIELIGPVAMESLAADLAAVLRVSTPGVLWDPRPMDSGGWRLLQLQRRWPAVLDQSLRNQLIHSLGEEALQSAAQAALPPAPGG